MHGSHPVEQVFLTVTMHAGGRQRLCSSGGAQSLVYQPRVNPKASFELRSEAAAAYAHCVFCAVHVRGQAYDQKHWRPLPYQRPDLLQAPAIGHCTDRLQGMSDAESQFAHGDAYAPCAEIESQDSPGGPSTERRVAPGGARSPHSALSA